MENTKKANSLADHLFRTEYGKMVASLTRIFGIGQMSVAEDIVQDTMVLALKEWSYKPPPPNPTAWLYVVAKNKAVDYIRKEKTKQKITSDLAHLLSSEYTLSSTVDTVFTVSEIKDNQLRMMFALCHPLLNIEAQITLILKTLGGFGNEEVAKALLINIETVNKRLYRAKEKLRKEAVALEVPQGKNLLPRLDAVLKSIYLLFNEGYNTSSGKDMVLSKDLCLEAMRLCLLLTENKETNLPQVGALLALMCFNASRFNSRTDSEGNIVLFKNQDRSLWDRELIEKGNYYLNTYSTGETASSYHFEAAIASSYCKSNSFEETDWESIYTLYQHLKKINPSPVVLLNMAIVEAYLGRVDIAIENAMKLDSLKNNHLFYAVLGDLYVLQNNTQLAKNSYKKSLQLTKNPKQKNLIERKIEEL